MGVLTSVNTAHQNVNADLADDLMVMRSDPIEVSDICGDEVKPPAGSCSRLGSKSRHWASAPLRE